MKDRNIVDEIMFDSFENNIPAKTFSSHIVRITLLCGLDMKTKRPLTGPGEHVTWPQALDAGLPEYWPHGANFAVSTKSLRVTGKLWLLLVTSKESRRKAEIDIFICWIACSCIWNKHIHLSKFNVYVHQTDINPSELWSNNDHMRV